MKSTVILGATPNPSRYAYLAASRLRSYGFEFIPVGIKEGAVFGEEILHGMPELRDVGTVTLYVGPRHQPPYYDWLIGLAPERIIFNPGTENRELKALAEQHGIETVYGCTLVMLAAGQY